MAPARAPKGNGPQDLSGLGVNANTFGKMEADTVEEANGPPDLSGLRVNAKPFGEMEADIVDEVSAAVGLPIEQVREVTVALFVAKVKAKKRHVAKKRRLVPRKRTVYGCVEKTMRRVSLYIDRICVHGPARKTVSEAKDDSEAMNLLPRGQMCEFLELLKQGLSRDDAWLQLTRRANGPQDIIGCS